MRVATRISIATGSLLALFLAVVFLHTSYARNLAASNLAISELNPVLKDAAKQTLLPDRAYPLLRTYFGVPSSKVGYLFQAQEIYAEGRAEALKIRNLCEDNHRILDARDLRSIIPTTVATTPKRAINPGSDRLAEARPEDEIDLDTDPAPSPQSDDASVRLGAIDYETLDKLLCQIDHQDARCLAAHSGQKIIALWDSMLNATMYYVALSPEEPTNLGLSNDGSTPRGTSPNPAPGEQLRDLRPSRERRSDEFWSRDAISEIFIDIKRGSEGIEAVLENAILEKFNEAQRQRESTERIALWMTVIAIAAALFFVWLTIRSFLQPMRELKAATRAVAEGQFRYQLDTSARNEFSGLSASFNRMVSKIAELDQLKSEFLSHISHEVRTPLAAMQETTNLLLDGTPGPVTPKQRRLLELTNQNCRRLTTMITQLLDLSRMNRGILPYEDRPHDFSSLVEAVVSAQTKMMDARGVRVETEVPSHAVIVRGDQDRLTQVLENLLTNAIKFSPRDQSVTIRVTHPSNDDHPRLDAPSGSSTERDLLCSISDHGPGVPDLHKEKIFEKFHQVDRRPKGSGGGVGLGLAICREIIAAHDGEIWVADNDGSGSTFYFTLPESRLDSADQGSLI